MATSQSPRLPRATQLAHELVRKRLFVGARAVDATVGNGHDTLFLAKQVGPEGKVIGFDVQEEAIISTRAKTCALSPVSLHQLGHERMAEIVNAPVDAIMFNLGYLPSSNKEVITTADTTLPALEAACTLLSESGILTIAVYPGHPGGREEACAVDEWSRQLDPERFSAIRYEFVNRESSPPFLIAVERLS